MFVPILGEESEDFLTPWESLLDYVVADGNMHVREAENVPSEQII